MPANMNEVNIFTHTLRQELQNAATLTSLGYHTLQGNDNSPVTAIWHKLITPSSPPLPSVRWIVMYLANAVHVTVKAGTDPDNQSVGGEPLEQAGLLAAGPDKTVRAEGRETLPAKIW